MSTAILISSSPPMFARDLTPVDDSPVKISRFLNHKEPTSSPGRFKTSTATRDSFSNGFGNAKGLLDVKAHAENLPLNTPGKDRFKTVVVTPRRRSPPFVLQCERQKADKTNQLQNEAGDEHDEQSVANGIDGVNEDTLHHTTPTVGRQAIPRRMDWTPAKDDEVFEVPSSSPKADAKQGFMRSFGFTATAVEQSSAGSIGTGAAITRRRRIDFVECPRPTAVRSETTLGPLQNKSKLVASKKAKAPTKKAKTITDLVTSHHCREASVDSPMAEFLVATQAKTRDGVAASEDDIEVATRATKRKGPTQKSQRRKKQLLSPASAMKAFNQQETVFGSASQLVKDGPKPGIDLSSDPVSPLRTQPISIGSTTPGTNRGTSRFINKRNLWGAADRDEDNALLYVDGVDLFDTPPARMALAGKDVLLDPEHRQTSKESGAPTDAEPNQNRARSAGSLSKAISSNAVVDVDDFSSPAGRHHPSLVSASPHVTQSLHTMAVHPSSTRANISTIASASNFEDLNPRDSTTTAPPKPSYAGMQTGELQKLIKGYGFKAIKSRQKMVDLLDKCWDEKEARRLGRQQPTTEASQQVLLKHSDFISNVHDLSNRPMPKVKKVAKKARDEAKTKPSTKEPKKRQKAPEKTDPLEKPKKSRGNKSKVALSEQSVLDVDDIDDDFTTLTTIREEKQKIQSVARSPIRPATVGGAECSVDAAKAGQALARDSNAGGPSGAPDRPDIREQIHAAILHQSEQAAGDDSWNHFCSPTWHEKMLMYDPIVIEDLARWLNAEGLDKVNEDREVTTVDVRDWCESKGICCMWKGGWRGQASKGGAD